MLKFCKTRRVKVIPMSQKFLENILAIMEDSLCTHYSHVTGEIEGYAHFFSNEKLRENYLKISVIAHNLFRFDFFLFTKRFTKLSEGKILQI